MGFKFSLTFVLLATVFSSYASANSEKISNSALYKITSVNTERVETPDSFIDISPNGNPIGDIISTVDGLITIGQKIWKIVDAGRPVVTNRLGTAISILPDIAGKSPGVFQMANWSQPKAQSYHVSFTNVYGHELVGFTYTVYFQYNGTYQDTGKYITNFKVVASEITTTWGNNFDASSELIGVSNLGSIQNPIAAGIIVISYKVKGLVNETHGSQSFSVDGLGNIHIL